MVDKLNELSESEKKKSPEDKNKQDPFRFEKQELAALRLSIEEKKDRDIEKSIQANNRRERVVQHKSHQKSLDIA